MKKGLVSVKYCVEEEKYSLSKYTPQIKEDLVKIAAAELTLERYIVNVTKKKMKKNRLKKCYMDNFQEKQNFTMKVRSGKDLGKDC